MKTVKICKVLQRAYFQESNALRHDSTIQDDGCIKFDIDENAFPPKAVVLHLGP